ncbi:hypothetical protein [Azovibrio restrictus]|uniref:hypothetical protein n=1 Tax=Azovibrio restrictus TaxID=146938 RepID=UPI0026EB54D9|nr:hypothetical protein [Azovibrio restrictus]
MCPALVPTSRLAALLLSDWSEPARFHVLFDGRTKTVRSTLSLSESQARLFTQFREYCSRPRRP